MGVGAVGDGEGEMENLVDCSGEVSLDVWGANAGVQRCFTNGLSSFLPLPDNMRFQSSAHSSSTPQNPLHYHNLSMGWG